MAVHDEQRRLVEAALRAGRSDDPAVDVLIASERRRRLGRLTLIVMVLRTTVLLWLLLAVLATVLPAWLRILFLVLAAITVGACISVAASWRRLRDYDFSAGSS